MRDATRNCGFEDVEMRRCHDINMAIASLDANFQDATMTRRSVNLALIARDWGFQDLWMCGIRL